MALKRALVLLTALVLLAAGCSAGTSSEATDSSPTFRQVKADELRFPEPISTVNDLLAPVAEDAPWRIVGSMFDPESGRSKAAVWSSESPPEWERTEIEPEDSDVSEAMETVSPVGDDGSLLAAGRVGEGDEADAALWRWDGEDWTPSRPAEMGGEHEQWASSIAVGDAGILVAGGETLWGDIRPRLWFSSDGENWKTVDGGPGGPLDTTGEDQVQAISAFGSGFVAVGMRDKGGEQDGVAWFSPDGASWEPVEAPTMGGEGRQNVESVAAVDGTIVAGGYRSDASGQGRPVVWRSTDGKTWGEASSELPLYDDTRSTAADLTVSRLTTNAGQIMAVGGDAWKPTIWVSNDQGGTWERLRNPVITQDFKDGIELVDIAGGGVGGGVLVLGAEPTIIEDQNGRWIDAMGKPGENAFPAGGDKPAATSVAIDDDGRILAGGFVYSAPDNEHRKHYISRLWQGEGGDLEVIEATEEHPDLAVGRIKDLATFNGGYVAVGIEDFGIADTRTIGNKDPDGVLWTSEDGAAWSRQAASQARVPEEFLEMLGDIDANTAAAAVTLLEEEAGMVSNAPAGGPGTRSLEAVAALGDGYITVGSAFADEDGDRNFDIDPLVAVSADGAQIVPENSGLAGPGAQRFWDVCVDKDGNAVAVGTQDADRNFDVAVQHRAADGTWTAGKAEDDTFNGPGSQEALGCAASEDGFLMVGRDDSSGSRDARVWTSEDGVTWHELPSGGLGGTGSQTAEAVAAVEDGGWLVAGTDTQSGDSDVALWRVMADGQILRRDRGEPALAGPGDQHVASLEVSGNRAVVVGEDQSGIGIWETSNLDR